MHIFSFGMLYFDFNFFLIVQYTIQNKHLFFGAIYVQFAVILILKISFVCAHQNL